MIHDYYLALDEEIGKTLELVDEDTIVSMVFDQVPSGWKVSL